MALVSQLVVEIAAKAEKVKEGLSTAMQYVMNFASSAASIIGKAFSGIGGIIANIIKGAFDQMSDAQDRLSTLMSRSKYLETPVKDVQALDYAINKVGGGVGSLDVAMRTMMKNVSQAVTGTGPAAQAIKDLGLNAGLLAKSNLTQQLVTIQDAVAKLKDQSKGKAILYQLFGESILPNLALFNKGLLEQFQAFEKLGTGIDASQEKIIQMNMVARSTFNELKEGFINQFTIPFLQVMTEVINAVQSFVERSGGVKVAAATVAKGVLEIFQSVAQGLGGVEGVILRLDKALTNVLITYNKAKMMGSGLWDSTKALYETAVGTVSRTIDSPITQPGWKTIKMAWQDAHNEVSQTSSEAQQNILDLSNHLTDVNGELTKLGDNAPTIFDSAIRGLDKIISDAKDPMKSLAHSAVDSASNLMRYSRTFTDAQMKAANATDNLAAAMKKAADKAMNWLQDPSSHMGNTMKQLLNQRDKEAQANEIDIPEYMKKASLEIYDKISELQAGDYQGEILTSLHNLQLDIINEKAKGGYGTRNNQESIGKDLAEFLKQKNLAFTKVKVDVNLDMTDEMKKIIKVNGVYTSQDTIDNMMTLKSQNAVNLGLAAAAAAAGT